MANNMTVNNGHNWLLLPAEVLVFGLFGHAAHTLASIPAWVGSLVSALVVGVLLRVLDPVLRQFGERLASKKKE